MNGEVLTHTEGSEPVLGRASRLGVGPKDHEPGKPVAIGDMLVQQQHEDRNWRLGLLFDPPRVRFDGRVSARSGLAGCVPNESGVYLIHDLRGVLYVGRALRLRRRFVRHLEASHNSWLSAALRRPVGDLRFAWILSDPPEQADLERELIRNFRPLCNHVLYGAVT